MDTGNIWYEYSRKLRSPDFSKLAVLAVVLTMNLRTLQFFPGMRTVEEGWFLLCVIVFCILYPLLKINRDWHFNSIELYLMLMLPVVVILPAFSANQEFGQPILYGVLAQRSAVLLLSWLVFIGVWRAGWVSARSVETVLVFLSWATFALYVFMRLALHPERITNAPPGFILGALTTEAAFAVPGCFMTFGMLYYAFRGIRERRNLFFLYSFLMFVNDLGSSGRFLAVSLIATAGFFLVRWRPLTAVLSLLAQVSAVAALGVLLLSFLNPALLQDRVNHFSDAFAVVAGRQAQDASANARTVETQIALPYIKRHPLTGNGILSAQWTGSANAIATYFFADDIGFVGIVFTYGFVGLALFLAQYVFAIKAAVSIPGALHSPLLDAAKGFVLYTAINSLTTGLFVYAFEQSSFFIVLTVLLAQDAKAASLLERTSTSVPHLIEAVAI